MMLNKDIFLLRNFLNLKLQNKLILRNTFTKFIDKLLFQKTGTLLLRCLMKNWIMFIKIRS
jgi:hypothetical protein